MSQKNVQREKQTKEEQVKATKEAHSFNIRKELKNIKIPIPLTELVKQSTYKNKISDFINLSQTNDATYIVNFQEEKLVVMCGHHVEEHDSSTPPFYIYLLMHTFILHNFMLY